jgi:hypothetical protein
VYVYVLIGVTLYGRRMFYGEWLFHARENFVIRCRFFCFLRFTSFLYGVLNVDIYFSSDLILNPNWYMLSFLEKK